MTSTASRFARATMGRGWVLAATLATACIWAHAHAQDQAPASSPQQSNGQAVQSKAPATTRLDPPFGVTEDKQRDVPGDLATADALGIRPIRITSRDSIKAIAPNGQAFKWVLTPWPELQLWGLPMLDRHRESTKEDQDEKDQDIIKHVIVTKGMPVQTAGIAKLDGDKLLIDGRSGHYKPSPQSVTRWGKPAFEQAGFTVECRDKILAGH